MGLPYLRPTAHRLYVTHGPRVEVLDSDTGKVVGSITGLKGTHGVALDDAGKYGYVSDGGANAVVVFDRTSLATVASIPAGTNPDGIVFEPKTKTVWAFNGRSSNATVIDTAERKVVATIALSGKPEFPVADGTGTVFANIETKNEIVRFDAAAKTITATWPLANCDSPSGLAIDTAGRRLFAVCDGGKMAVVDANTGKTVGQSGDRRRSGCGALRCETQAGFLLQWRRHVDHHRRQQTNLPGAAEPGHATRSANHDPGLGNGPHLTWRPPNSVSGPPRRRLTRTHARPLSPAASPYWWSGQK